MFQISKEEKRKMEQTIFELDTGFTPWIGHYKDLADYILPLRSNWLYENNLHNITIGQAHTRQIAKSNRNQNILDATGTRRARDLAAGMLNGVTSPARPWFSLRPAGFPYDQRVPSAMAAYLNEVSRRALLILAESNFYNAMGVQLLDLVVFGTAGMMAYEDFDDVVRFYNLPIGSFRIAQNHRRVVDTVSKPTMYTVRNLVAEFGLENVTRFAREKYEKGGTDLFYGIRVHHLIEPNREDGRYIEGGAPFREFYWEPDQNPTNLVLRRAVYNETPGMFPRWETLGDESYGLSPGMDALGDIKQLQQETLRKAVIIDKLADPAMVFDASMRNKPTSTLPGARNFAPSSSTVGAKPIYQPNAPLAELSNDIIEIQHRIGETFSSDLFRMISQIETVRSATEIDARREEKLVLLGAVLERLENEALDPLINRLIGIMNRKGLLPPAPPEMEGQEIEVQYVSVLSDAQRAAGTGSIERFMQVVGNTAGLVPEIMKIPDWDGLIRDYGDRLNITAMRDAEEVAAEAAAEKELLAAQQAALVGGELTNAAKNLSQTDLGGGQNAMQALLGG